MTIPFSHQGSLFTADFLSESIQRFPEWSELEDDSLRQLEVRLRQIFNNFGTESVHTEADTETELIWPILESLGWAAYLTQQNLSARGRQDVPDGLLFLSEEVKARATAHAEHWKRFEYGSVVVESKRWTRACFQIIATR